MDFRQPISYLFPAIIITMAGVLVFKIYKKGKGRIRFSCILFIIYIEILMQTAFFSREPGSRQQIDLNLFGTWGQTAIAHAYFIENIIMFIPFGLLAPMVFERMRKVRFCVFIGFLCSCGIELSQLITQRGYCQLDDVVTNTVGMLVGWGIWKMLSSVFLCILYAKFHCLSDFRIRIWTGWESTIWLFLFFYDSYICITRFF